MKKISIILASMGMMISPSCKKDKTIPEQSIESKLIGTWELEWIDDADFRWTNYTIKLTAEKYTGTSTSNPDAKNAVDTKMKLTFWMVESGVIYLGTFPATIIDVSNTELVVEFLGEFYKYKKLK